MPLYLDECLIAKAVARQLRGAGHLVYVTSELGLTGADDAAQLQMASDLRAVLATQNQKHFAPLHDRWQAEGRSHNGILVTHWLEVGLRVQRLERAARMLTPEAAANQFMPLTMFDTEQRGLTYVVSLTPPAP